MIWYAICSLSIQYIQYIRCVHYTYYAFNMFKRAISPMYWMWSMYSIYILYIMYVQYAFNTFNTCNTSKWIQLTRKLLYRTLTIPIQTLHGTHTKRVQKLTQNITLNPCKSDTKHTQKLRWTCANVAQKLHKTYAEVTKRLRKSCEKATQKLRKGCVKSCAKVTQKLRENYNEHRTCAALWGYYFLTVARFSFAVPGHLQMLISCTSNLNLPGGDYFWPPRRLTFR